MTNSGNERRSGLVYFDPEKFERQLIRTGFSKTQLAEEAGIKRGTVIRVSKGSGMYRNTAQQIAQAFGLSDVTPLLKQANASGAQDSEHPDVGEWEISEYLSRWILASNGLQFRVCRMQHRFIKDRMGRGKWYDLLGLTTQGRQKMETQLLRHPTVCERIGRHDQIAENLSTYPGADDESWWVVDRWHAGRALSETLAEGPYPMSDLPALMKQIGLGLKALHDAGVVFRELGPSRVLLTEDAQHAILADFELAKLLDSNPIVSKEWPDDPYRAPEVRSGAADPRSDLYSWGRILVHAAAGTLPPPGEDVEAASKLGLPKAVWRTVTDCLAPGPDGRPKSMDAVLQAIRRWK